MARRNHQALRYNWSDDLKRMAAAGDHAGVSDLVDYIREHVDQIGVFEGLWAGVIAAAAHRSLPFAISKAYALRLYRQQDGVCAISGVPISFRAASLRPGRKGTGNASLDRINSDLGYVEGNVWWVHRDINRMKGAHKLDRFIELCRKVAEHDRAGMIATPGAVAMAPGEMRFAAPTTPVREVAWFLRDCCEDDPLHRETAAELWRAYREWCRASERIPRSQTALGRALAELGFRRERGHICVWYGLRIVSREGERVEKTPAQPPQPKTLQ